MQQLPRLEALTPEQAAARYEQLPLPLHPATLHPRYVAADAVRDAALQPIYLRYAAQGETWLHSLHLTQVPGARWRAASSPYGYGGPLATSDDPGFIRDAWTAYCAWMRDNEVVAEYLRFHPLLANERFYGGTIAPNREVVSIDLGQWQQGASYALRLRQGVRKAEAAGLAYSERPLAECASEFGRYYRAAMGEIDADPFFLFDDAYFAALAPSGRVGICTAPGAPQWLAACLLLDGEGVREYHLAATCEAGRRAGASSFALHRAAQAAHESGYREFYLGGGTDPSPENRLLFFKSAFSPRRLQYHTGSTVFDPTAREELKGLYPQAWQAHPERPIFWRKV